MGAPSPPDPIATAAAQGASNRESAIASGFMNNPNENTPFGSVQYDVTGTYKGTDAAGQPYEVPRMTKTVNLSAEERRKKDLSQRLGTEMLQAANRQVDTIQDTLSRPINTNRLPPRVDKVNAPSNINSNISMSGAARRQNHIAPAKLQDSINTSNLPALRSDTRTPNLQNALNMQGAPDRINRVGTADLSKTYDASGQVQNVNLNNNYTRDVDMAQAQGSYADDDFSKDRSRVEEALMSRLSPQFDRDRSEMETQLVNQGFTRGSEAFNNAMEEIRQTETDARMQAVLAGGQEQSRMLGEARSAGQFANDATAQNNASALARGNFQNDARYMTNQDQLAQGSFNNSAQAQRDDQAFRRGSFANTAEQQDYANRMGSAQFTNDQRNAALNESLARGTFANDSRQQQFANRMATADQQNAARQQGFDERMSQAGLANEARLGQFNTNLASGQFQNQSRNDFLGEQLATQQAENQARNQRFQSNLQSAGFQNDARSAGLQEQLALRSQPLNEMGAALSGGQVNIPQFQSMYRQGIEPSPVADSVYRSYEAEAAQSNAMMSGLFGLASAPFAMLSDKRTKVDYGRVGKTDGGIPIHKWRYKGDDEIRIGPMAQDVAKKQPEAALVHQPTGLLGIDVRKLH